jgi:SAM-dependent methyltransferase
VELQRGDICTIDLRKRFDVAIAMFAVMGYQTTNEALESALRNAANHLNPGGLLIFDAWFGPTVIAQKLHDKILIVEKGAGSVIRLTRSKLDIISQTVNVNFTVLHVENDAILDRVEESQNAVLFPERARFYACEDGL